MTGAARRTGTAGRIGVLVMAHGTPTTPDEIETFYTAIRRGRQPPPELLAELTARYRAIGGTSPLNERTTAQVEGIATVLEATAPGAFVVRYGAKFADPSIETAMEALVAAGVDHVVGIVLTPHESSLGSGEYMRRAVAALGQSGDGSAAETFFTPVPSWHRAEGLAELFAERTTAAMDALPSGAGTNAVVFFTAHSLPERALIGDDPYPAQVGESASDVAALLCLDEAGVPWGVAWQSAGRTPDPWLGPDLLGEIRRVAAAGATSVVVCPVGFVSDHLEILYDLDIEAARVARESGVAFARTRSLDDDPRFLAILAEVVRDAASRAGRRPGPVRTGRSLTPSPAPPS